MKGGSGSDTGQPGSHAHTRTLVDSDHREIGPGGAGGADGAVTADRIGRALSGGSVVAGGAAGRVMGKGERYCLSMDVWLPLSGMTLLEEEEMPEFVACPSSYVTLRNAVLERWHADCCREYTVEQAKHDVPRVFHHPAAQASTVSACGTMCAASSATRPGLGARARAYCVRACVHA